MAKLKLPAFKKPDFKNKKTVVLSLLFVVAITAVVLSFFGDNIQNKGKLYAEAAGHKIYEKEVRDLVGDNKDVTDQEAAIVLADKYFTEALAKERGITVSDEELIEQYGDITIKQKDTNRYAYQNKLNQTYLSKLQAHNRGVYKGKFLIAHFSRFVPYKSPLLYEDKQIEPRIGNKTAIAKDKKYAENLINKLYGQVQSGQVTFEEAAKIERKDALVGEKAYPTLSHSGSFDTTFDTNTFMSSESIREQIGEIKTGELTKPIAIKVVNSMKRDSVAESYFLSVLFEEAAGGENVNFDDFLTEAKQRLGYKTYI